MIFFFFSFHFSSSLFILFRLLFFFNRYMLPLLYIFFFFSYPFLISFQVRTIPDLNVQKYNWQSHYKEVHVTGKHTWLKVRVRCIYALTYSDFQVWAGKRPLAPPQWRHLVRMRTAIMLVILTSPPIIFFNSENVSASKTLAKGGE